MKKNEESGKNSFIEQIQKLVDKPSDTMHNSKRPRILLKTSLNF